MTEGEESESKSSTSAWNTLFVVAFWVCVAGWIGYVFVSPYRKLEKQELPATGKPKRAVSAALEAWLSGATSEARIEPRGGNNLEVYVSKDSFESVRYPDRGDFTDDVGAAWCENTGRDSHWVLPSVKIRDIRSGDTLGSYSCVFSGVFSKGRISPSAVDTSNLRMSLVPGWSVQTLTGPIKNNSNRYTLKRLTLEITVEDCSAQPCHVVDTSTTTLRLAIPPGQTRNVDESVAFSAPLVDRPQGSLRWHDGILFAGGGS